MGKTALVTGSAGFVGRHLVNYLKQKCGVNVLEYDIRDGLDITDYHQLRNVFLLNQISEVYHLAAQAFVGPGEADPYRDLDINGKGMINVLRCLEEFRVPMVFTSSGSVYGLTDSFPHREDAALRPVANYGCTKRLAELYLQKWAVMVGVNAKAVRFSSVYGPGRGMQGPVNVFVELAKQGKPLTVYGDGSQTRDLIHVDDAVRGLRKVLQMGKPGEVYNVGCGVEHSVREVAEIVSGLTGAEIRYVAGHEFSRFDIKRSYYDIGKARGIGFEPRIGLEDGIKSLICD